MPRKPVANLTCCINLQSVRSKLQFSCLVLSSSGATQIVSIRLWCWIFYIGRRWIISWLGTWAIKDASCASPCQWLASGKIIKEPHKGCCFEDFYWYWVHGAIIWCSSCSYSKQFQFLEPQACKCPTQFWCRGWKPLEYADTESLSHDLAEY